MELSASCTSHFIPYGIVPNTHWIEGWVDSKGGLNVLDKRKSAPARNQKRVTQMASPYTSHWAILAPTLIAAVTAQWVAELSVFVSGTQLLKVQHNYQYNSRQSQGLVTYRTHHSKYNQVHNHKQNHSNLHYTNSEHQSSPPRISRKCFASVSCCFKLQWFSSDKMTGYSDM